MVVDALQEEGAVAVADFVFERAGSGGVIGCGGVRSEVNCHDINPLAQKIREKIYAGWKNFGRLENGFGVCLLL